MGYRTAGGPVTSSCAYRLVKCTRVSFKNRLCACVASASPLLRVKNKKPKTRMRGGRVPFFFTNRT